MHSDALLDGLNEAQLRAVTTDGGPVVVMAGAGSGKTRVLTRRIAWRVVEGQTDPNRVLALTFTRAAATELRQRLLSLGLRDRVNAGTFHATALLQLRQRWSERNQTPPALLDRKIRFVAQLLPRSGAGRRADAADVASEIDWARARLVGPEHYAQAALDAGRTPPLPPDQLAQLLDDYQQLKRRKRMVDFDDLLLLAIRDLQTDPPYADAVRWRFRHLYVDEMQDVNPLQYELLMHWRGNRPDLFIVGDPNQAIYGWNGADPTLLSRFVQREKGCEVVELVDNYRSSPQVLALAGTLTTSTPLLANRSDGPIPTITAYPDDAAEAAGVAQAARAAHSVAGRWSDQAVLVRTNAQLLILETALHDAGIPIRLKAGAGPLATPEVQAELRLLANGAVGSAPSRGAPSRGAPSRGAPNGRAGSPAGARGTSGASAGSGYEAAAGLAAYVESLDDRLDVAVDGLTPQEIDRRANLAALAAMIHDYLATDPAPSPQGFTDWVATLQSGDVASERDGVELMTFHGAKGLEWPVVHVAGLEEGFVPIAYAKTGAQANEERRLLYVALTRAAEELHLSWAAQRTFGLKVVNRQPSPHLGPLSTTVARLGVGPAHRVDWRAELARSRQSLAASAPPTPVTGRSGGAGRPGAFGRPGGAGRSGSVGRPGDDGPAGAGDTHDGSIGPDLSTVVYQALDQWRRRRARAADVPPHVVFTDQTLRAIAKSHPRTRARLASMPGMGPAKLQRYGDELLQVLAEVGVSH